MKSVKFGFGIVIGTWTIASKWSLGPDIYLKWLNTAIFWRKQGFVSIVRVKQTSSLKFDIVFCISQVLLAVEDVRTTTGLPARGGGHPTAAHRVRRRRKPRLRRNPSRRVHGPVPPHPVPRLRPGLVQTSVNLQRLSARRNRGVQARQVDPDVDFERVRPASFKKRRTVLRQRVRCEGVGEGVRETTGGLLHVSTWVNLLVPLRLVLLRVRRLTFQGSAPQVRGHVVPRRRAPARRLQAVHAEGGERLEGRLPVPVQRGEEGLRAALVCPEGRHVQPVRRPGAREGKSCEEVVLGNAVHHDHLRGWEEHSRVIVNPQFHVHFQTSYSFTMNSWNHQISVFQEQGMVTPWTMGTKMNTNKLWGRFWCQ